MTTDVKSLAIVSAPSCKISILLAIFHDHERLGYLHCNLHDLSNIMSLTPAYLSEFSFVFFSSQYGTAAHWDIGNHIHSSYSR